MTSETAKRKRARRFRNVKQTKDFDRDWERLDVSGRHDMHRIKEAISILAMNEGPMPSEWKDHPLTGNLSDFRECHVKGDLLLVYQIIKDSKFETLMIARAGTHSEIFGR